MAQQRVSQGGLSTYTDEYGRQVHVKTFTCCHCNQIHDAPPPGAPEVGFCQKCHARECIPCGVKLKGVCTPFVKRIEAYEKKQRLLAAVAEE